MKFFLSQQAKSLSFTWNDANKNDWQVIKSFFIAAYVNAYSYIYRDGEVSVDPLELDDSLIEKARCFLEQQLEESKLAGVHVLDKEVFDRLSFYYTDNFKGEKQLLASYVAGSNYDEKLLKRTLHYIHHLFALIYYFEDSFAGEKRAIENTDEDRKNPIQYVVARFHERPVGFISSILNYKTGQIYLRWVNMAPGFQGNGLGRRILEAVENHYPDAIGFELYTRKLNKGALQFYPSCGFGPEERVVDSLVQLPLAERAKIWLSREGLFPPDDDLISAHHDTYIGFQGKLLPRAGL